MYISVLGGDLFACSGELLIKMYCVFKMEKNKHDLCLWAKGVRMSGWAILGLKSCVSQKLIPQARIMDKWVPADGGGACTLGYDHTAAKYGCHSKAEVHTQFSYIEDDHQLLKKHTVIISAKMWIYLNLAACPVNSSDIRPWQHNTNSLRFLHPPPSLRCELLFPMQDASYS